MPLNSLVMGLSLSESITCINPCHTRGRQGDRLTTQTSSGKGLESTTVACNRPLHLTGYAAIATVRLQQLSQLTASNLYNPDAKT